jgi:hypothetical protein
VEFALEEFKYRMPYESGGTAVDRVTLLNVTVEVISPSGKVTKIPGFPSAREEWDRPQRIGGPFLIALLGLGFLFWRWQSRRA